MRYILTSAWTIEASGAPPHDVTHQPFMASPRTRSIAQPSRDMARQLLEAIAGLRTPEFTGVGVVFYDDGLDGLPHLQLTSNGEAPDLQQLPGADLAQALATISMNSNPLHDGFHFVDVRSWTLTHLSQFISPPIPPAAAGRFHGTGARLMAAVLASLLPGIQSVGLVSSAGQTHLFSGGVDVAKED